MTAEITSGEIPTISVVNKSVSVTDSQAQEAVDAIQIQLDRDFGPAWDAWANLKFVPAGELPGEHDWIVTLSDNIDQDGCLGYHQDSGKPSAIVDVAACLADKVPWSACLSHEILEMVADPEAAICIQVGRNVYSFECSDPVEGKPYFINGVAVENFVFRNWFVEGSEGPWDYRGVLDGPLKLAPGGYCQYASVGAWAQQDSDRVRASKRTAGPGSRRSRRIRRAA